MKILTLSDTTEVLAEKRRVRRLKLTVRRDGQATLTLPFFVSYARGMRFLEEKKEWISAKRREFLARPVPLLHQGTRADYLRERDKARALIASRLTYFKASTSLSFVSFSVRNQKTRWGSCSRQGKGSFNYRLLHLPEHLRDYIIVHELCHLLAMNHSRKFWNLVVRITPDCREHRRALRKL